jgi:hypothetical protein
VPRQPRGGPQPAPLVVEPQQDLRDGQAGQFGVGDGRGLPGPQRVNPREGMIRSVSST